jgi:hypothetical protein
MKKVFTDEQGNKFTQTFNLGENKFIIESYLSEKKKLPKTREDFATFLDTYFQLIQGTLRPWLNSDGHSYITAYIGGDVNLSSNYINKSINIKAPLTKQQWKQLDEEYLSVSENFKSIVEFLNNYED